MEDYLGSIKIFAFNWAPMGYTSCFGQLMAISQNTALFALLGTAFGGDGQTSFAMPDLRGRVAVGEGTAPGLPGRVVGEIFGSDQVTLTERNLTPHTHTIGEQQANQTAVLHAKGAQANDVAPAGHYLAVGDAVSGGGVKMYTDAAPDHTLASDAVTINTGNLVVSRVGQGLPFQVDQPSLVLGYTICVNGLFPSRN